MEILEILGLLNLVVLPAIAVVIKGSHSLRIAITDALKDGKLDQDELDNILKESGLVVRKLAKFLKLFTDLDQL